MASATAPVSALQSPHTTIVGPVLQSTKCILCVPGHRILTLLPRARAACPDLVLLDLEDSVPCARKQRALSLIRYSVNRATDIVRTTHPQSLTFLAEAAALHDRVGIVMIPKVESLDDLITAHAAFGPTVGLITCIESPAAVWHLRSWLHDAPNFVPLLGLAFGRADYIAASPIGSTDLCDQAALEVSAAAASLGIHASDGPCYQLHDPEALLREVNRARLHGYTSKGAIHPSQVEPIRNGLQPTPNEISQAQSVLRTALSSGGSVVCVDSHVVAPPTIAAARKVFANAVHDYSNCR